MCINITFVGVSQSIANIVWLIDPVVAFFIQPLLGSWSDRCGNYLYVTYMYIITRRTLTIYLL